MKTYKDLTKDEKEMLNFYYGMTLEDKMFISLLLHVMFVGMFIGTALIFVPHFLIQTSGMFIFIVVIYVGLKTVRFIEKHKKNIKLIFDVDDIIEDVFEITKQDREKIKRKLVKIK